MIAKKFRLPIQNLTQKPERTFSAPYFLVKIYSNNLSHNRFGIIASLKFDKKANVRNLWRRRLIAAAKKRPNLKKDFLFILLPPLKKLSYIELENHLKQIIK